MLYTSVVIINASTVTPYSYTTRHVSGIQLIKHIGCYGQETGLMECSYSLQSDGSGSNCEDVALHCMPGNLFLILHACVERVVSSCGICLIPIAHHPTDIHV